MKKTNIGIKYFLAALLFCVGMTIMAHTVNAQTAVEKNGSLSVDSRGKVVNESGKSFVIKGISTHGIAWFPEYINRKAFKNLRNKWGANTVRLAMYTSEYGGYCTGGDTNELLALIDKGVGYASDLGMYVIIDWHILSDGNPLTYKTQAKSFFKKVAKKYADHENVIYEICNEPNGWEGSWSNIKKYSKEVIKQIRSEDDDAIIIVGTPTWSQDVNLAAESPITGYDNIVYAFHFYAATHKDDYRAKLKSALDAGLPVIVSEFGISEASGSGNVDKKEGNKWIRLLDKYRVGRVCWNFSNKDETSALIKSSCKKTSGWTKKNLTASGRWIVKKYKEN